jgi:hypothetical protein
MPAASYPSAASGPGAARYPAQFLLPASTQQPAASSMPAASGIPAGVPASGPIFPGNAASLPPGTAAPAVSQSLPGSIYASSTTGLQGQPTHIAQPQDVALPRPENKFPLNIGDLSLKRLRTGWQLWAGQRLLRDFGDNEMDGRDTLRVFRDLRPTEWVVIGAGKPIVEYGLVNGRPPLMAGMPGSASDNSQANAQQGGGGPAVTGAGARQITPIDLRSVRVEAVQGVWCLRDEYNIHINFGADKPDADQTIAAVRKYGFNRVGVVGNPGPVMTYLFASPEQTVSLQKGPYVMAALQYQIDHLSKVGIPVAGLGYVGEMVRIDPRAVSVRQDGSDWLVTAGGEVLGRFGPAEWIARDAARTIQEAHFTEFCTAGSAGLTFFLVNGQAPTRVPYNVQGRQFDPHSLRVRVSGDHWAVTEGGRTLVDCASPEEGETLIRLIQFYQFDQLCHLGPTQRLGVSFLARTR